MVKIVKSTAQMLAKVTGYLLSYGTLRALVKSLAIQLVISLSLFAGSNSLDGFNVTVKDSVAPGKTGETEHPVKKLKKELDALKSSPKQGLHWIIAAKGEKKEKIERYKASRIDEEIRMNKLKNDLVNS